MLDLSIALARRALPGLADGKPKADGMRSWLENGSFYIESGAKSDETLLRNVGLQNVMPYLTFDYERFAFSALETFISCGDVRSQPRAISWPLLRAYYSAFFAAHATMRSIGRGVIRLEAKQSKRLSEVAKLYSVSAAISSGTYEFSISQAGDQSISVALTKLDDTGGAHDVFWRRFYLFLSKFSGDVVSSREPNATAIVAKIGDIQALMSSKGHSAGTWLASMRNEINYQHKYGGWFPYRTTAAEVASLAGVRSKSSSAIRLDFSASKMPIHAFCACCHVISALCSDTADIVSQRTKSKRFSSLWARLSGA